MRYKASTLYEAFDNKMASKGTVRFLSSDLKDKHIQDIIKYIVSHTTRDKILEALSDPMMNLMKRSMAAANSDNPDPAKIKSINDSIERLIKVTEEPDLHKLIERLIEFKLDELKEYETKAPLLYSTAIKNGVESSLFSVLQHTGDDVQVPNSPKFNVPVFYKLVRYIKIEHGEFFPLRSFVDSKYLDNPVFIISPDPKHSEFDAVTTACATPTGKFVFNKGFCQKLLDYAHLKGLKPKGRKYVSNGGDIPDEWAYIEFLIIHEFMHYTQGDFHYGKVFKGVSPTILNYVGDFRTNYLLVKSGLTQLPIGLYSDDINYDRQKTYKEMIDVVTDQMKNLKDEDMEKLMQATGETDSHEPGNEEGQSGKGSDGRPITPKGIDAAGKASSDKMDKGKDLSPKEADRKAKEDAESQQGSTSKGGRSAGSKDVDADGFDFSKVRPAYSWQALMKKFVTAAIQREEETYQKVNKKSISSAMQIAQTGVGVVKPGIITDPVISTALIVDSSGSMHNAIETIYANYNHLMRQFSSSGKMTSEFALIKFSNTSSMFRCDYRKKTYTQVTSFGKNGKPEGHGSLSQLFNTSYDGSTNLDERLVHEAGYLLDRGMNVMLASDTDILSGGNLADLKRLLHHPKARTQLFIIFDSEESFAVAVKTLGSLSRNISYFK
jgi:hypothetical protein